MRGLPKLVATLLGLAIAALVALLFVRLDAPWVATALTRLAAAHGVELEVDRAVLDLRRGALLEGVVARTEATGERVEASLERLVLEHRLWPLLGGRLVVERLVLERPSVEMVSAPPGLERGGGRAPEAAGGPDDEAPGGASAGRLRFDVAEVEIRQGRWESRAQGRSGSTRLEGLDLTLRDVAVDRGAGPLLLSLSARGWLEAAALELGDRRLTGVATAIDVERGRYRLAQFETAGRGGRLRVDEIEVDLAQDPYRYRFDIAADGLDLAAVLGVAESVRGVEEGLGPARLVLRGTGEGPGLGGAVAEMRLDVAAGRLPSLPLLARLDRVVGTSLDGAACEGVDVQASLVDARLEIEPFTLVCELVRLEAGGAMTLDGALDLHVAVGLPRELFERTALSDDVAAALTDRRQWLAVPLHVTGTASEPRLRPDTEALAAATRQLGEAAGRALQARIRVELDGLIARRLGR